MPSATSRAAPRPRRKVHHPFEGRTDTRRRRKLKEVARTLPRRPGVYFFHGWDDRLLYIGKACCLRERVGSYFAETALRRPPKLRRLLAEVKRLEWRECGSELEALLLERRLIAERLPLLNRQHKRFAIYPYLLLTAEEFPRFTVTRTEPIPGEEPRDETPTGAMAAENLPGAGSLPGLYLGPFTSPRTAASTFEAVRSLFPLRSCEGSIKVDAAGRSCFYHDIGRCCGPCVGAVSREEYAALCDELLKLLREGDAPRLRALRARMLRYAEEWKFEEAAQVKEQLRAIEAVAARLARLQRMREQNNVVIVQPSAAGERGGVGLTLFLVRGGLVRGELVVHDPAGEARQVREALLAVYAAPPAAAGFTARTELDEMMILDRWLTANGTKPYCLWQSGERPGQWAERTLRAVAGLATEFAAHWPGRVSAAA